MKPKTNYSAHNPYAGPIPKEYLHNPFKSEAQRGFMYAKHPEIAKRWQKHTPKGKLPRHVGRK